MGGYYLDKVYHHKVNYKQMAIQSFSDKNTEEFFITGKIKKGIGWVSVNNIVKRKLDMLHYAAKLKGILKVFTVFVLMIDGE